jgi:hypothetical protein
MKFIAGNDRGQTTFFCLDEMIDRGNEVRLIDLFVGSLKMEDFGFRVDLLAKYLPGTLNLVAPKILIAYLTGFLPKPFVSWSILSPLKTLFDILTQCEIYILNFKSSLYSLRIQIN